MDKYEPAPKLSLAIADGRRGPSEANAPMLIFAFRRFLVSIPVLIASTIVTFILVKFSGDPLNNLKSRNPRPSAATIHQAEARLYLDHSWPAQYWHWLSQLVMHWQWGPAAQDITTSNVNSEIFDGLIVTLRLVIVSIIVSLILAVITGVISATRQYSPIDYTTTFFGFLFLSMPVFWFGFLLKQFGINFNGWFHTSYFATLGERSVPYTGHGFFDWLKDVSGHMVFPVITLSLVSYAAWSRFTRASMLETLNSDYVRLARSKGLPPRTVLVKHALRNALTPLATVTALDIAVLLGGTILTETVFQWHGMGYVFIQALTNRDYYVMLGWLLVSATIVILFNLIADLLYGVLDPRVRDA